MPRVVGVRFRNSGRSYHFDTTGFDLRVGDKVVVETARGIELGHVASAPMEVSTERITTPLKPITRLATPEDLLRVEENTRHEKSAFVHCREKVRSRGLDMNIVDAESSFDGARLTFYFTAEGRIDFRELVKDLASIYRMRIELRQIGVRDEARMVGGLGICGRELCCSSFLREFAPVSIKMAKEQNLSMNPAKISGACGRLLCCLKYEQEAYEDANSRMPRQGAIVMTKDGQGIVADTSVLKEKLMVRLDHPGENEIETYMNDEVEILRPSPRCPRSVVARAVANGYVAPPPPPPQTPKAPGQGGRNRGRGRRDGAPRGEGGAPRPEGGQPRGGAPRQEPPAEGPPASS